MAKQDTEIVHLEHAEWAIFAGGCFLCMEPAFEKLAGVLDVTSGYAGGHTPNPTYEQVSAGNTGHAEVVRVAFDPKQISYANLLEVFWRNIDPTVENRQFCDVGSQYRSEIFTTSAKQYAIAKQSKEQIDESGRLGSAVKTHITDFTEAGTFYAAEDYHQNYYKTHPLRYNQYRNGCGRDKRLTQLWGSDA